MSKLRECRIKFGKSQNDLASDLKVTARHIGFLETGERTPSLELPVRIANYFNT